MYKNMNKIEIIALVVIIAIGAYFAKTSLGIGDPEILDDCVSSEGIFDDSNQCLALLEELKRNCAANGGKMISEFSCEITGTISLEDLNIFTKEEIEELKKEHNKAQKKGAETNSGAF